jgi:hypothetical protein
VFPRAHRCVRIRAQACGIVHLPIRKVCLEVTSVNPRQHWLHAFSSGGFELRSAIWAASPLASVRGKLRHGRCDAAVLPRVDGRVVMTTDSYVVSPLFFPGGDIGMLAVHGTVNDLVVSGAEPMYLSLGLIIEDGLPLETRSRDSKHS